MSQRSPYPIARLDGSLRSYAWGSHAAIATLQGREHPTAQPEAELWFGAHPSGPARLLLEGGPCPLDEAIARDPVPMLGDPVIARFGPRLPFLLKVLAIDRPLSLQAHPSAARATQGYRDEDARGVPLDAPERIYRDAWPKPELLCALSEVDALAGFREPGATRELLEALDVPELRWLVRDLGIRGADALADAVERLLRWPGAERLGLIASLVDRAEVVVAAGGVHAATAGWLVRLGVEYPADPGVAVAALLNLIRLRPGEAIHVPAGSLHAYLRGTAVEIMATSDTAVRGGLTVKHVDVEELLRVLDPAPLLVPQVTATATGRGRRYVTSADHFALERIVPGAVGVEPERAGPEIVLSLGGTTTVAADRSTLVLASGEAAFVPAATGTVRLHGEGPLFRATVGTPSHG